MTRKTPLYGGVFFWIDELHFDLGIDASWEREILQGVNRLWSGVRDVDEALVDFHLESLTTSLVDMWGFDNRERTALGR